MKSVEWFTWGVFLLLSGFGEAGRMGLGFQEKNPVFVKEKQSPFYAVPSNYEEVEFSSIVEPMYSGIATFGRLENVECLSKRSEDFDIAFIGMPFDTGTSYRPGARFGPSSLREGSRRINTKYGAVNVPLEINPFKSWAKLVDCGDIPVTTYDILKAMDQLESAYFQLIARKPSSFTDHDGFAKNDTVLPRVLSLGGDHTIVLPILRALHRVYGQPISVIHFDSHLDTWAPGLIGDGDEADGINHGSYFYFASQEGIMSKDANIHAGIRTPISSFSDYDDDVDCGFKIIEAREIDDLGIDGIVKKIRDRVGDNLVYLSIDIDVLDPAFAPATGTPETGGWSSREMRAILRGLQGLKFVGADLVEVAPAYDVAEITSLAGAQLLFDIVSMMVKYPLVKEADLSRYMPIHK
ncbi:Agmatinase [Schizosaccharomyces pombe]|uniref:Putative agmatinase 3 n=1 Tax=Schizosaccharomyces pombe (strain 972 / ATCC 24843) TaxID=284812 RepID=SPEB3_SCHPO|nr:putative agmatinase [Schizosaccharomyces pombe]Q9C0Y9.2 RecName: Full=Putative agmatinase 3; AltName: Full=Agmatine ureohydrolase 3; Short=AUH 3; Flags: Precursor [Schizosaccharomyces pombe 972h-]CAC36899.2 agmatinase (predicted) [Schizosaccharomyces pombe]|eukprot:NP_593990.2 putative agmatinase [Schizosaccharomyces pombe]